MRRLTTLRVRSAFLGAALLVSIVGVTAQGSTAGAGSNVPPPLVAPANLGRDATDQIIVRLRDGSVPSTVWLSGAAGQTVRLGRSLAHGSWVTRLPGRRSLADVSAMAQRIAALPGVASAEPDRRVFPSSIPNDPSWSAQWDLFAPTATTFGANLPAAWDVTRGTSDVVVAVIDTGITNHVDLAGQTVPGYDFIADATTANDGNGRDADPSDPGDWITSAENASGFFANCGVANSSWHGTHVSGTIAAVSNNSVGVAGIASGVKILPVRVLGKCGGYTSDIVDGMRWAAGLAVAGVPTNPNPASVLNFSLGGSGACPAEEQSAINDVVAVGASVVVAAGNSNVDASGFNPANCNGVITVAATGATGNRAFYSNFGTSVEITAPGGDSNVSPGGILSTLNAGTTVPTTDTYASYQGTSMATPHVAGVAALVKSVDPSISPSAMTALLQSTVTPFPVGSTCTTLKCGAGELNAAGAVAAATVAYGPRVLGAFSKASPAPGAIGQGRSGTLTWSASSGATSYSVCLVASLTAPCTWTAVGNVTSMAFSGLAASTLYSWQVRATNGTNTAEANVSLRSTFTTDAVASTPTPPTSVTGTRGDSSAMLNWVAPSGNGGAAISDYVVEYGSSNSGPWTTFAHTAITTPGLNVTGLTNGVTYYFHVAAKNSVGVGVFSAASSAVTPAGAPGAPTSVGGTPGNGAVGLSWTAPAANGSAITNYVVQYGLTAIGPWTTFPHAASSATNATVTGLGNATAYYFQVAAINGVATGGFSAASAAVTTNAVLPGAPTAVSGVRGNASVALTWTAPIDNGGSAISDYAIRYSSTNGSSWSPFALLSSTSTNTTVTGLSNGVTYVFQVAAVNGVGQGASSATSAPVTLATKPDAPSAVMGTAGVQQVALTWTVPASDGGSAITDYSVQYSSDGGSTWTTVSHTPSAATSRVVSGLQPGVTYVFQVAAVNGVGMGAVSSSSGPVRVLTTPGVSTSLVGSPSNGAAALSWTAPADNGGSAITDYLVQFSSTNGVTWITFAHAVSSAPQVVVTGLTNGVSYEFRVAAVNDAGTGGFTVTSANVTPRTVPGATVAPTGTPGDGQVALTWGAPNDGGSPILDYVVQWSTDGVNWATFNDGVSAAPAATVVGLGNGVGYRFRVTAVNVVGAGAMGAESVAVVPRTAPSKPAAPRAKAGNSIVTLSWVAPANGGSAITDYAIEYSGDHGLTWKRFNDGVNAGTSYKVVKLVNGHRYLFRVAALNVAGIGLYSLPVAATPATPPAIVARPTASSAGGRVSLHWLAPSNGGAAITDYGVQYSSNNGLTWVTYNDGVRSTVGATLVGLRRGVSYRYRVAAINVMGRGVFSAASAPNTLL